MVVSITQLKKTPLRQAAMKLALVACVLLAPLGLMAQTLTVYEDATSSNKYVPFDGYNADAAQHNQMIYPATELTAMVGKSITQMVFYIDQSASNGTYTAATRLGTWTVSLGETAETTLSGLDNSTSLTQVYQGNFDCSTGTLTLLFDDGYVYNGGNLLVDFNHAAASWNTWYFLGVTATGASYTYSSQRNFLPKVTFTYETPAATPKPTGLAVSNILHNEATLNWTENGTATTWHICVNGDEGNLITATSKPYTLTGLSPLTAYTVKVRSVGSSENSAWSNEVNFSTSAVAEVVGDSWSDDFEGVSCGWELVNGNLTNANWAWGTAVNNGGTHAIYISNDGGTSNAYNNSGYAKVFATKLLNFAEGKYTFSFDWKCNGESTYDYLRVGLVPASTQLEASNTSDNTVPTGWVALDNGNNLSAQTTWQHVDKTIQIAAAGNYYLVLRWRQDNSTGNNPPAAVDNVSITRVACPYDVEDLAVTPSSITTTGATITWTAGEATQWQVATKTGDADWAVLPTIYSTNSAALTGLTAATTYQVKARAYCNASDQGTWCDPIPLTTACPEYAEAPFTENFDGYTVSNTSYPSARVLPTCWSFINTSTYSTNKWYPTMQYYSYTNYSNSSPNYIRFYIDAYSGSNYDPQDQYLILPAVQDVADLRIKLQASVYNTGSTYDATFKVGIMTDPTDASTFVEIAEKTPATTSYEQYIIPFNGYTGSGNHIAIKVEAPETPTASYTHAYRAVYIDDITVEMLPNCLETSGLAVVDNSITTNSVQLQWTAGGSETQWDIYCTTSNVPPTAETTPTVTGTEDNPCTVSGLTHSSHYYAYVRARCSASEKSPWSNAIEFETECVAFTITAGNFINEGFEDYEGTTYSNNGVVPTCWLKYSSGTVSPHVIGSGSYYYKHEGTKALTFYGSGYNYAALPELTNDLNDLQISFWMQCENASYGTLTLGYITSSDDGTFNTFNPIPNLTISSSNSMVQRGPYYLSGLPAEATRLVFRWYYSGQYSCCIDDVVVKLAPTCRPVSSVACGATTAHTATLSWTENGSATAWQVSYSTNANFDPEDGTIVDVNANPGTITNLAQQSTTYYAYVRANCGGGDYSEWNTTKVTFATGAGNVTPSGLTVDNSTITSSQATASWNAVAGNTLHQSYDIYWAPASVTQVPTEPTATNLISGITATSQVISGLEAETTYKVWVRDNCGTDGYSNWSSTPFTFMTAAACQTPDGLAASNVTNNSATISWNTYGLTAFNLRYSTDGENWTPKNNVNSPYTIDGTLSSNTAYQVQVQATCNTEAWSSTLEFNTLCDPVTISAGHPWTEDFEAPVTSAIHNTSNAADLVVPDCWDNYTSNNGYVYYIPHIIKSDAGSSGYNYSNPASQVLYFYGQGNSYAALPFFSNALNELQISFKWATEGSSQGTLTLGYITAEDNGTYNTFTQIGASYNANSQSQHQMKSETVYLNNVPNTATRLVFRWYYSGWYGVNIDDIEVSMAPSCYPLGTLTYDNVGTHSVELSWELVDANQTAWVVEYADNSEFNNIQTASANTHTDFELAGLTPETHYWVRVKADCGNSDYGEVSNVVDFTTGIACHAPSALTASNETTSSMVLSWTNGEIGQDAWVIAYMKDGDADFSEVAVTTNPYTLTGLTDGKTYTLKVRANCGVTDGLSQWSGEITHATVASCSTPTNVAYSDVNAHGATITWNGEAPNHNIEYRVVNTADVNETYDLEDGSMPTGWTHIGNGSVSYNGSYAHSTSHSIKFSGTTSDNVLVLPDLGQEINIMTISYWSQAESASQSGSFDMGYVTNPADASTFHAIHTNSASTDGVSYTEVSNISLSAAPAGARIAFRHRSGNSSWYWFLDDITITYTAVSGYGAWQTVDDVTSPYELNTLNPETIYEVRVIGDCGATTSPASNIVGFTTGIACYAPENFAVDNSTVTHNSVELSWTATGGTSAWVVAYKADGDADFTEVDNVTEHAPYLLEGLDPETHYTVKVKSDCGGEGYSSWSEEKTFTTIEACAAPTAFVLGNVAVHQATFSWTAGNGNTAWKVYVKEHAAAEYPSSYTNATTASATISELEAATAYDVKIVPTCDENKILEVENAFTTLCEAVTTFPWTEDFNSLTVANTIPVCWDNEEGTTTNANYKWCYTTTTGTGGCNGTGHNGSNCVRFNSYNNSNTNTNFLKSPVLSLPAGQPLQLKFWYKNPAGGDFSVYISTDGGATHTTDLVTGLTGASSWTEHDAIDLSSYAGQDVVIVFKGTSNWGSGDAYIYLDDVTVAYTVEKAVEGNKWYAISSPVHNSGDDQTLAGVTNLTTSGAYDLYGYTESAGTWNKATTVLEQGKGYIYRVANDVTLKFTGVPNSGSISHDLSYACSSDNDIKGFNLVGNPFPQAATPGMVCYSLTPAGTWHAELATYNVPVCEAVLIKTNGIGNEVSFTPSGAKHAPAATTLAFTVSNGEFEDVAYAKFDGDEDLPKIGHLEPNAPALSIPVGDRKYAIANLGSDCESFEMTFSGIGDYTISASGEATYLHLIDKVTGSDIDLLSQPTYSFRASLGDLSSRFLVKLAPNGENANNGTFAFWNGNSWTIEGEGTLEAYDVMGRRIFAREANADLRLPTSAFPSAGVYILRLGGNSQKVVIK